MSRRAILGLGATGLVLAAVALVPQRTAAAWTIAPSLSGSVSTLSSCSTPNTFNASAQAQTFAGTVLGQSGAVGALAGSSTSSGTSVAPSAAANQGGGLYSTTTDLTGTATALNGATGRTLLTGSSGYWYSTESTATTGVSTASAGAVAPASGALLTSGGTPLGTLDVSGALGTGASALSGLSGVTLAIGTSGAQITFDGCRSVWGMSTPLVRSYHVGSLALGLTDAGAAGFDGTVATQDGTLQTGAQNIGGTAPSSGLAASAAADLRQAVLDGLKDSGVSLSGISTSSGATVTVTVPTTGGHLSSRLGEQVASGGVTLDTGSGASSADLAAVLGALDGQSPNTAVITAARCGAISSALGSAMSTHAAHVESDWSAALQAATVRIQATASASGGGLVTGASVTSTLDVSAQLSAWSSAAEPRTAPSTTGTTGLLTGLLAGLPTAIGQRATTDVFGALDGASGPVASAFASVLSTADSAVNSAQGTAASTAATEVGRLNGVVAITLNQQADVAPQPAAYAGALQTSVTALHVVVAGSAGTVVDLDVANASAGPNWSYGRS